MLPSQIVLPPTREASRAARHGPVHVENGSIVIGRILAGHGESETTPDGRPGVRAEFPQGIVIVPTDDPPEPGTRFFAQVRETEGRTLLRLLDGVDRGTLFQGTARTASIPGGQTVIDIAGGPSPADTSTAVQAGDPIIVQLQPRGARATLQALPATLTPGNTRSGTVLSAEGPLLTVDVDGVHLLARPLSELRVGDTVTVRIVTTGRGLELVAQATTSTVIERPGGQGVTFGAVSTGTPEIDGLLESLALQPSSTNRAAVAALVQIGYALRTEEHVATSTGPALTALAVGASAALQGAGLPVTPTHLSAALALLDAEVAVTPEAVQAAQTFLADGVPVAPTTIAAAIALIEIAVPPQPRAVEALAAAMFGPSTLAADIANIQEVAGRMTQLPDLPAHVQPALQEVAQGLSRLLVDLQAGATTGSQVADAAHFGGLHTEAAIARVVEAATQTDIAAVTQPTTPALTESSIAAARDLRVLVGRLQTIATDLAMTSGSARDVQATLNQLVPRVMDRLQGLQLQNLRAPVLQHLTVELPVAADGGMQNVHLRVYYRADDRGEHRVIDERNTTVALLLDTTQLGSVNAAVNIVDGLVNVDFRVDTADVANHLLTGAEELRAGLAELEYAVGRIGATPRRRPSATDVPTKRPLRLGPGGIDVQA